MTTESLSPAAIRVLLATLVRKATKAEFNVIAHHVRTKMATETTEWTHQMQVDLQQSVSRIRMGGIPAENHLQKHILKYMMQAFEKLNPFAGLDEGIVTSKTVMPLCMRFLDGTDRLALVTDLLQRRRETLKERLSMQPILAVGRAVVTRALFRIVAGFLTNVELVRKFGRLNRAWFLFTVHNDFVLAGGIVPNHNMSNLAGRLEWLREHQRHHGMIRAPLLDLWRVGEHEAQTWLTMTWPDQVVLPSHIIDRPEFVNLLTQHASIKRLSISHGWNISNYHEKRLFNDNKAVAWLASLHELELQGVGLETRVEYSVLRHLTRFPRVIKLIATVHSRIVGEETRGLALIRIYDGLHYVWRAGRCPGLESIHVCVTAYGYDDIVVPKPPKGVTLEVKRVYSQASY